MFRKNPDTGRWEPQTEEFSSTVFAENTRPQGDTKLFSRFSGASLYIASPDKDNLFDTKSAQAPVIRISATYSIAQAPAQGAVQVASLAQYQQITNVAANDFFWNKFYFSPDFAKQTYAETSVAAASETPFDTENTTAPLSVDGHLLKVGDRFLLTGQTTTTTLPSNTDPSVYFSEQYPCATYSTIDSDGSTTTYIHPSEKNGIWEVLTPSTIGKVSSTYKNEQITIVRPYNGISNISKVYYLVRNLNGCVPNTGESEYWTTTEQTLTRTRFDYNNLSERSYNGICSHGSYAYSKNGKSFPVPSRTVAVGEFGTLVATGKTPDELLNAYPTATKETLNDVSQTTERYWMCGNRGTLAWNDKHNPYVHGSTTLPTYEDLLSISFFSDNWGAVCGKNGTLFTTDNGGTTWEKHDLSQIAGDLRGADTTAPNKVRLIGDAGTWITAVRGTNGWTYEKTTPVKSGAFGEAELVDDLLDQFGFECAGFGKGDFPQAATTYPLNGKLSWRDSAPATSLEIKYTFPAGMSFGHTASSLAASFTILSPTGSTVFAGTRSGYDIQTDGAPTDVTEFEIWKNGTYSESLAFVATLPNEPGTYTLKGRFVHNYDNLSGAVGAWSQTATVSFAIKATSSKTTVAVGANGTLLCERDGKFTFAEFPFGNEKTLNTVAKVADDIVVGTDDGHIRFDRGKLFDTEPNTNVFSVGTYTMVSATVSNRIRPSVGGTVSVHAGNDGYLYKNGAPIDPDFPRKSPKLAYLDYSAARKTYFHDDNGKYRLPAAATLPAATIAAQGATFSTLAGETSWADNWGDTAKTFGFRMGTEDQDKILPNRKFRPAPVTGFTFSASECTLNISDFSRLAPNVASPTASAFAPFGNLATTFDPQGKKAFFHRYLAVFRTDMEAENGDTVHIVAPKGDFSGIVARTERYINNVRATVWPTAVPFGATVDKYLYCYVPMSAAALCEPGAPGTTTSVRNTNLFDGAEDFAIGLSKNPMGIAYGATVTGAETTIFFKDNNKTRYHNGAQAITSGTYSSALAYPEGFLSFGFGPSYNLLDALAGTDPNTRLGLLPEYSGIPFDEGNDGVWADFSQGSVVTNGTVSWTKQGTNEIKFGSSLELQWETFLKWTFVDIELYDAANQQVTFSKKLITDKRRDENGLWLVFDEKLQFPPTVGPNTYVPVLANVRTRNKLSEISADLEKYDNISGTVERYSPFAPDSHERRNRAAKKYPTVSYFRAMAAEPSLADKLSGVVYSEENEKACAAFPPKGGPRSPLDNAATVNITNTFQSGQWLGLNLSQRANLSVGDSVHLSFNGGTGTSETLNPQYFGTHEILSVSPYTATVNVPFGQAPLIQDIGQMTYPAYDPYLNIEPVDAISVVGTKTKDIRKLDSPQTFRKSFDSLQKKFELTDGLTYEQLESSAHWLIECEAVGAVLGQTVTGSNWSPIWKSGICLGGRWLGGRWLGGDWYDGDWYEGTWEQPEIPSTWRKGRWYEGTWVEGTWLGGNHYGGTWKNGTWKNGTWHSGTWENGKWLGGTWINGKWESGTFDSSHAQSYWLDGEFSSGDFLNGTWYSGRFGTDPSKSPTFGIGSKFSRPSIWHSGEFLNGSMHSGDYRDNRGNPTVSARHDLTIWKTGRWSGGEHWGGVAHNIEFSNGTWHGGVSEEIQIVGAGAILPATQSQNYLIFNGDYRFKNGSTFWIVDAGRQSPFDALGTIEQPKQYRVSKTTKTGNGTFSRTYVYVSENLSDYGVPTAAASATWSETDLGIRAVSKFDNAVWETGVWLNGIFDGGKFKGGLWIDGKFENGTWGDE